MSQYLFEENRKKSRRKALYMTILFHIVIIGGVWFSTLQEESPLKTNMSQWISKFTGEDTADNEYNVRP